MKILRFSTLILTFFWHLSAQALPRFEFSLNLGPSLSQSGSIQDLGDPNINTGYEFNYFFSDSHGVGFSYSNEFDFDGSDKFKNLEEGSISTFDIHYAYRLPLSPNFHFMFEPGFGWQTLYEKHRDLYWGYNYQNDLSHALILDYKLMVRYHFGDIEGQTFFLGGGFMQIFSFDDDYKGKDISGSRFSGLFQAGFAF